MEMERGLMQVYHARGDYRVLDALERLLNRHQELGYHATLAITGRLVTPLLQICRVSPEEQPL